MPAKTHTMHGRDHCPEGADPIPCMFTLPAAGDYVAVAFAIGSLRAYWRLGEASAPFADTSGYAPGSPDDLTKHTNGTAMTVDVTGALASGDDGAVTFNYAGTTSSGNTAADWLSGDAGADGRFNFNTGVGPLTMSAAAWIKPQASANTFDGGIVAAMTVVAGSPSYSGGWALYMNWPARTVSFRRAGAGPSAQTAASGALAANEWAHVAATYDGTDIRVYINAELADTTASAVDLPPINEPATVGNMIPGPGAADYRGRFYGSIDEAAVWEKALSAAEILALYNAGVTSGGAGAEFQVLESDGAGGTRWAFPTVEVEF